MRVLIVDKQPLMRKGIAYTLNSIENPPDIFEAKTLFEATNLHKNFSMDIVFIGLDPKEENGFELINNLILMDKKSPKFILMADSLNIFEFRKAKELEIEGYILKEAEVEDVKYAYNLILKGEKYYSSRLVDKALGLKADTGMGLLTDREMDVLIELSKGLTNSQIGSNLYISEGTAKKHISNILSKLNMSNRMEVLVYANRLIGK